MASRPTGYGLTAEIKNKMDSKYDPELAGQVLGFIEHHVPDCNISNNTDASAVAAALKDGTVLCKLANALQCSPKPIKFNESKMAFKQMENIGKFLEAIDTYGVSKADSFQTVDLYEAQNIPAVINGLQALGRKAQSKGTFGFGPKESKANKREFTQEQLRAGEGMIGLQMGSNKGATQAGQNFGKTRAIID